MLGRLAEAGLNVALAIERQAMAAADEGPEPAASGAPTFQVVQGDLALAYGRAARAVRLTLALQARLIKDLQALDEGEVREQAQQGCERQKRQDARKARVERIVERVIKAEITDEDEIYRLTQQTYERLDDEGVYGDLLARPVSEIIARICRDLGLSPDWSRLAQEAWAQEEIDSGAAAAPLMTLRWVDLPPEAAGAVDPAPKAPQPAPQPAHQAAPNSASP
jgi:hypothetical protein